MGFNYIIDLNVLNGGAFGQLSNQAAGFEKHLDGIHGDLNRTNRDLNSVGTTGRSTFDGMSSSVGRWVAGLGIAAATLGSLQTTAQSQGLENAITFASGSAIEGAKNLEYLRQTADQLGLSLRPAQEGFKTLSGSLIGTGLSGQQARDIFHGVASASTAMGLTADQSTGAFLALGQMASKGKVQAEELRGQLGERLSGSFYLAAKSMGYTTVEFDKMLETGKVFSTDFLPKFAAQLETTFGAQALANANSATANFNRMETAIYDLKVGLGTALMPVALGLIREVLIPGALWIGRNADLIMALGEAVGIWVVMSKTAVLWQGLWTAGVWAANAAQLAFSGSLGASIVWAQLSTVVTGGFTAAVAALNTAFWANPIMWVVGGLALLAVGVVYAWNKFEGFRGFIVGMWEAIKEFGRLVYDFMIQPLMGAGKILAGVLFFNPEMVMSGLSDFEKTGKASSEYLGDSMATSFTKGWNGGISAAPIDPLKVFGGGADQPGAFFDTFANNNNKPTAPYDPLANKSKELGNSITGGGQKNVTINITKLVGIESMNTTNLKEGADVTGDMILQKLIQSINSANQVQLSGG